MKGQLKGIDLNMKIKINPLIFILPFLVITFMPFSFNGYSGIGINQKEVLAFADQEPMCVYDVVERERYFVKDGVKHQVDSHYALETLGKCKKKELLRTELEQIPNGEPIIVDKKICYLAENQEKCIALIEDYLKLMEKESLKPYQKDIRECFATYYPKGNCLEDLIQKVNDEALCKIISYETSDGYYWVGTCYQALAIGRRDPGICQSIADSTTREICIFQFAKAMNDSQYCKLLQTPRYQKRCSDYFLSFKILPIWRIILAIGFVFLLSFYLKNLIKIIIIFRRQGIKGRWLSLSHWKRGLLVGIGASMIQALFSLIHILSPFWVLALLSEFLNELPYYFLTVTAVSSAESWRLINILSMTGFILTCISWPILIGRVKDINRMPIRRLFLSILIIVIAAGVVYGGLGGLVILTEFEAVWPIICILIFLVINILLIRFL